MCQKIHILCWKQVPLFSFVWSLIVSLNFSVFCQVDICCGTGGIGLSLAEEVGQLVGLDILEDSVEDAKMTAMKNNITNCEFYPGR